MKIWHLNIQLDCNKWKMKNSENLKTLKKS